MVDSRQPPTLPWLQRALWLFPCVVILIETLRIDPSIHLPKYILTLDVAVGKEVERGRCGVVVGMAGCLERT